MVYGYIPPFVLESMARAGIEDARISIFQSMQSRNKRIKTNKDVNIEVLSGALQPPAKTAGREVYNSKNTYEQRVKPLVRGEADPVTGDTSVDNAYDYTGVTRDYFKDVMGRNSIDNLGMNIISNVHYGVKYMNAFWDGDEMTSVTEMVNSS